MCFMPQTVLLLRVATLYLVFVTQASGFVVGPGCLVAACQRGSAVGQKETAHVGQRQQSARTLAPTSSPSPRAQVVTMAGFGGGEKAPKPKATPPSLTKGEAVARENLKLYNQLKREGGEVARVYAREKGTEKWYPVGHVCTEPGKLAEGLQGQKRLVLEHADAIHQALRSGSGKKLVLEVGYAKDEGDEVTVCKATHSGEKVGVALDPFPSGPFFRGRVGLGKFIDSTSAATLLERKKYT